LAPLAEAGTGVTSHTFTKVDREALDAAMALSAMVSPGTGGRTVSPGARAPQPAAPAAPVAPTEEIVEAATPVASPRPDRPARPAPPVPRWNDTQPSEDEADSGFVRISSRDRQKRVLGT
jgi:hypothetical protein